MKILMYAQLVLTIYAVVGLAVVLIAPQVRNMLRRREPPTPHNINK